MTGSEPMTDFLFVCTGNHYRSRLAEGLFQWHAERLGLAKRAASAGLAPRLSQSGPSEIVGQYFRAAGIPESFVPRHPPRAATADLLLEAGCVILLNEREHLPMLEARFGWVARRLRAEERLQTWHVADAPPREGWVRRFAKAASPAPTQPPESATEHIDFGVRALILAALAQ